MLKFKVNVKIIAANAIQFFLLFLVLLFSCSVQEKTINDFSIKIKETESIPDLKSFEYIMLVPGAGCPGCVSDAEKFAKEIRGKSDKVFFIFTDIRSKKILELKLGFDLSQIPMYIDMEGVFNQGPSYSFYPTVYYLNDGEPKSFKYLDPNNYDLLNNLKTALKIEE